LTGLSWAENPTPGKADGFERTRDRSAKTRPEDGKLTVGELIDYILYTTEHTVSEAPRHQNIARPRITGSFDRGDVLFQRAGASAGDPSTPVERPDPRLELPADVGR
jgi:hypothetical protein